MPHVVPTQVSVCTQWWRIYNSMIFIFGQQNGSFMAQPFVSQRAINGKINFLRIFPYYIWITAFEINYSYFVYVKTDTRHGHETSLPFHGAQSVKSKFVSYMIIYKILPLIHKKQLFIKYPIILGVCVYVAVPDIGYSRSLQPIVYLRIMMSLPT